MHRTVIMTSLGLALALAACNRQPAAVSDNDAANAAVANGLDAGNDAGETSATDTSAQPGATDSVTPAQVSAPVEVVAVPAPAATTPATDAVPLDDAAAVARAIDQGGYDRVRSADGWAWRHDGQIVRTASLDGRRVAYYHPGNQDPYLVQDNGHTYEYRNGRIQRAFDDHGREVASGASERREAEQAVHDARNRHDAAPPAQRPAPQHRSDQPVAIDQRGHDQPGSGHVAPPPPANPGPQGNRVTEHKGQPDPARGRDDRNATDRGDRQDRSDQPHL